MSPNLILIQFVVFTCLFMLLQASRLPRGWLVVAGLILMVLILCFATVPELAGWISGSLWGLFIVLPLIGYARVNQFVVQERYGKARRWASILRWFHPADGLLEYPHLLNGLELAQKGRLAEANQILGQYQTQETATGKTARALLYRISAQWDDALIWTSQFVESELLKDATIAPVYLRSLGETGNLNALLEAVDRVEKWQRGNVRTLSLGRLYALAFSGQPALVYQLFNQALAGSPEETRQFWLATAEMAAGNGAIAQQQLKTLRDRSDPVQQNAIDWRLAHPCPISNTPLTHASQQILARLCTSIHQEARYGSRSGIKAKKYRATYALIGINCLVFGIEILVGGSEDLFVLYRLGALVPERVLAGEWWRTIAATFLHAGTLHLTANMVGLFFFGRIVESAIGSRKFLLSYFFSGVGSMIAVTLMAQQTGSLDQLTVGASGAVMGILGVEVAIQLKGWRQEKARAARERFRLLLVVIGIQFISDLITPQVSMVGHVSGLILGFLAGMVLFQPEIGK